MLWTCGEAGASLWAGIQPVVATKLWTMLWTWAHTVSRQALAPQQSREDDWAHDARH